MPGFCQDLLTGFSCLIIGSLQCIFCTESDVLTLNSSTWDEGLEDLTPCISQISALPSNHPLFKL